LIRRLSWLNRELTAELQYREDIYRRWKQGKADASLDLKLTRDVKGKKKSPCGYIIRKSRLLNGVI